VRALLPTFSLLAVAGLAACDATPGQTDRAFSATGEIIAMGGGAGGAANACFTCHGLQGQGDGNAAPRLAGLDAGYLQKQMEDYASGLRQDDVMTRIAKALDQKGRRAVAAYYAGLSVPAASPPPSIPAPAIYSQGDPSRGVVACAACHGDQGQGTGRGGNPQIAGQPFAYTLEQIDRWKSGERRNDPRGVMAAAVRPLSDEEARAIALWLSTRPASPAPASAAATGSASVDAAARPAASRETRRPDRSDGA
jgi:cytochrome c553